ncbi:MAG: hypothetical protein KDB27_24945 [Planctomycetales bacterium]|nr:hypothetical protein [Planctomycetales bacterium]
MDDDIQLTAYHEAGHAVMAWYLGGVVERLTISPDTDDGPSRFGDTRVVWRTSQWSERELAVREIKVSLAGPVVEMVYSGDQYEPQFLAEWQHDWAMAVERASTFLPTGNAKVTYLQTMIAELIKFIERDDTWAAVAALADELEAHESLGAEEVSEILRAWPIG